MTKFLSLLMKFHAQCWQFIIIDLLNFFISMKPNDRWKERTLEGFKFLPAS